ncbi:P-loop containing nucleoside triphosphate hydrolase protein [Chytriomyces cf. hyalinus JEL632]|nr:P-loop containing nucleoside triphosphate hydrolase protein [Chytriomyces cf. hyalinus JEL632]
MKDFLVACVGKPSAGKSSFLNAVSDAAAKVGNFPFTTIKPNHGVAYVHIDCPCKRFGKQAQCAPKHGKCVDGTRMVPLRIMDVAGLVPGASTGEGLGNQFLDDLRTADLLIHVVDASGTTDAAGKVTIGYDPINDIDWLREEIHSWIFMNLWKKWPNIVRRHTATAQSAAETLALQFSGYGANLSCVQKSLDRCGMKDGLDTWDEDAVRKVVDGFLDERFPTIIALNKIDLPDSDKNVDKIFRKYDPSKIILTSALAEVFLRKLHSQGFINYHEGTEFFDLADESNSLKPIPAATQSRLEKVQDLVLFRYGNTGVQATLKLAMDTLQLIPAFPVRNINSFGDGVAGSGGVGGTKEKSGVFRDCVLVKKGTKVGDLMADLLGESKKFCLYAETVGGVRVGIFFLFAFCVKSYPFLPFLRTNQPGEDDEITLNNSIMSFKLSGDAVRE